MTPTHPVKKRQRRVVTLSDDSLEPPGPAGAATWEQLCVRLRLLRAWSGFSYRDLHRGVVQLRQARGTPEIPVYNTVYRCLQSRRARLDADLVADIATVLLGDPVAASSWRQACALITEGARSPALPSVSIGIPVIRQSFVGREEETDRLLAQLDGQDSQGPAVCSIVGMPGVGKTSFARHLGQLLTIRSPGAVAVWVDLGGSQHLRQPAGSAAILDEMLIALGVAPARLPGLSVAARRAELAGRLTDTGAVVVLDDAASASQVRPLIPRRGGGTVLVTSRHALPGQPGTSHTLAELGEGDAVSLIENEIGADRVAREPAAVRGVIALTGRLPLALTLFAGQVHGRPDWTLADHLDRLRARRGQLRLDDEVTAALAHSYEGLSADGKRALRAVALHPGPDLDIFVANALIGAELSVAQSSLEELHDANLIGERDSGRFALHDLVRVFAAGCGFEEDAAHAREQALDRELTYFLLASARAMERVAPQESGSRPAVPSSEVPAPELGSRAAAVEWLDAQRANLLRTAVFADERGRPAYVQQLSRILFRYLNTAGHYQDAKQLHSRASHGPDPHLAAHGLVSLGITQITTGQHVDGRTNLTRALTAFQGLDDAAGAARALLTLGILGWHTGNYPQATDHLTRAIDLLAGTDPAAEAAALGSLGVVHFLQGNYAQALAHYHRSAALARSVGDANKEAHVLINAAEAYAHIDRLDEAEDCLSRGTDLARSAGNLVAVADGLNQRAVLRTRAGRPDQAVRDAGQALATAKQYEIVELEIQVLDTLARALYDQHDLEAALDHHRRQLALANDLGDRYNQARAHDGIARCSASGGQTARAKRHWELALKSYSELGNPAASDIASRLAELHTGAPDHRRSADRKSPPSA